MAHTIEDVVRRDMCIGCGACSIATSGATPVTLNARGMYEASIEHATADELRRASRVCPFSDDASNEDDIAGPLFGALPHDAEVGHHLSSWAGRVSSGDELMRSSSGGLTTWLLTEVLERGLVDGVVHVGSRGPSQPLFGYTVSSSSDDVAQNRKSIYYATTMDEAVTRVRGDGRRYAIVGVPCYIKAARLLCAELPDLAQQLVLFVGIVCGHLKSQFFAESLGWQAGVEPAHLTGVDFRVKNPSRGASAYDYSVTSDDGAVKVAEASKAVDGNWGYGAFQPEACNFCDDIFAETADVVLGDAWLPRYESDWRGTNVVLNRSRVVQDVLDDALARGVVELEPASVRDLARSQAGNFRHRRAGLRVRLADDGSAGLSVPRKRVTAGYDHVSRRRARLIRQRRRMSRLSFESFALAKESHDLSVYLRAMRREIRAYKRIDRPLVLRVLGRARRAVTRRR